MSEDNTERNCCSENCCYSAWHDWITWPICVGLIVLGACFIMWHGDKTRLREREAEIAREQIYVGECNGTIKP